MIARCVKSAGRFFLSRCLSTQPSYVHMASSTPLLNMTIGQCLTKSVEKVPNQELFVFSHQGVRKTFCEVLQDSQNLAKGLLKLGLRLGDRVGIWGPNYYEWVVTQFGSALAGMVLVTINPMYRTDELEYALRQVGVKALITPTEYKKANYYRALNEIIPQLTSEKEGIGLVHDKALPDLKHLIIFGNEGRQLRGAWNYTDIESSGGKNEDELLEEISKKIAPDQPVNVQYTSGTTGYPKAATLSHHNILNNAYLVGRRIDLDKKRHTMCVPNPLYHCFGCVIGSLSAIVHQNTCIFPAPAFNARKAIEAIDTERCTCLFGTPTMFIDIIGNPHLAEADISSLHMGIISGAPCPKPLCERLVNDMNLKDIVVAYGSTELSPVATCSSFDDPPLERIKNVGYPIEHSEVSVVDENGCVVPRGEPGELRVRGWLVMREYWGDVERTEDVTMKERWYRTGDTAIMNETGSLNIVGRSKDMIIRGGENIYPAEIEQFLFKHHAIADVHIIGVPDERFGEEMCAWIRLKEGHVEVNADSIKEYCRGKLRIVF
ncbi:hypothetical protein L596_011690 [Steinernema carpocapsae]|uniref:Medium-chain acyl-CoA ligase ACSF2, mitochondrial n=1 Tax=Steinernema carpocapsae TaxID=34508 RepID=A0A4U5NUU2_STECR|nr:hypothetical protein L596_011690 [Steinernema carpocapsae]